MRGNATGLGYRPHRSPTIIDQERGSTKVEKPENLVDGGLFAWRYGFYQCRFVDEDIYS
jgi:hypothetical protein